MGPQIQRLTEMIGDRFQYEVGADKTQNAVLTPLREALVGSMRPALVATFAAMGLILLIACANVAALMLGQVEGRASELAVRSALGATRGRIMQQLVVEAMLVGLGAGLLGAALAAGGYRLLAGALPIGAWGENASFGWSIFAAAPVVAVVSVVLVLLVPAASLWRGDLRGTLTRARTGGIQGRGGRLERGLVVAEVALAMLIASSAALLVRSVANLYAIDPGITTKGIAVVDVTSSPQMEFAPRLQKVEELVRSLGSIQGVRSVGAAMKIPLRGGGDSFGVTVEGHPEAANTFTYFRVVTRDYFATMGMKLRDGRTFDGSDQPIAGDDSTTEMAVVVNEAFVKKYFAGENPIGRRLGDGFTSPQRVIGVVDNVQEAALTDEAAPVRYYLAGQAPWFGNVATFVLRTARPGDAATVLDAARRTVSDVTPELAVQGTTTMERVLDTAVGPARKIMSLLTLLSALALVLGAVGIYGVISHFAARRKRDWAIRVALGLPGSRVVSHIVGQGAALVSVGIVLGAMGAVFLARVLASFLFGVGTVDLLAFAAASAVLLVIGVAAAAIPARRAGTVDPALVMREQ
jgi:predicted permease